GVTAHLDPRRRSQQEGFAAGWELWQAGREVEAIARWEQAGAAELVLDQANLLLFRGELSTGAALCQAVLTFVPTSARAYFLLGQARRYQGNEEGARQAWEEAVRLDPDNRAAQLELGLWYEAHGDTETAYVHLQQADPAEATHILWQRIWPYFNGGNEQAGLAALDLILRLAPTDANAWVVKASRLRMAHRDADAQATLEELWRVAPGDIRYYLEHAQLLDSQGRGKEALADLEEAVRLAPRSAEAWFLLGQMRRKYSGQRQGAIEALEQAVSLHPNAWYATELGNAYREAGDLDAAVAAWERAVTLPGCNAHSWWTLGQGYEAQERWKDSAEAYARAVLLDPQNADLYALLARAYTQAGERAQAIAAWESALALRPGVPTWQEALARLKEP
ncbi:MAG: tetratricopeptide repeat protein, partial [Chloroflexia bacterium]